MEMSKINFLLDKDEIRDLLNDFFYSCINEICGCKGPTYQQFIKIGWNEDEYNDIRTLICNLFTNPTLLYLDKTKLPQEFLEFSENIQVQMFDCLKEKQKYLVNALMKKYSQKNIQTLIDFDWRLKVILGSSEVASLREPLLQLDLRVMENEAENIVDLELNKNELDHLIKVLEAAI
ncbi:hypothetical protein PV325_006080 [Microctonus aethiopoides]|uniref:COMM domain-containing protein n=1 Tax=Microctonus aethiopoides TaxID=144406 RepID=A0AA39FBT4_9HYME|nr:hypothetical protein PV325_006080 [Microctonus aethiopoides]KAK0095674.1 hypothetical protein PV326_007686 [Microctonus aethiopoides]KAK0166504.1 hypothetical protein PV328_004919 [Microctonus aethiopoides]